VDPSSGLPLFVIGDLNIVDVVDRVIGDVNIVDVVDRVIDRVVFGGVDSRLICHLLVDLGLGGGR
jgi:hypothetical protein